MMGVGMVGCAGVVFRRRQGGLILKQRIFRLAGR